MSEEPRIQYVHIRRLDKCIVKLPKRKLDAKPAEKVEKVCRIPVGTLAMIKSKVDGCIQIAAALCSDMDQFDYRLGRKHAMLRLTDGRAVNIHADRVRNGEIGLILGKLGLESHHINELFRHGKIDLEGLEHAMKTTADRIMSTEEEEPPVRYLKCKRCGIYMNLLSSDKALFCACGAITKPEDTEEGFLTEEQVAERTKGAQV